MLPNILNDMSKRDDVDMASFRYFAEHFLGYIESGAQSTELSRRMVMRFKAPAEDNTKELIFGKIFIDLSYSFYLLEYSFKEERQCL